MSGFSVVRVALALLVMACAPALNAAVTVASLEALALEERQTRDHHAALALAFQSEDKPGPAAEALAVFDQLPGAASPVDLDPVRKWIRTKSVEEYKAAVAFREKQDNASAVKSYLRAIMLDPAIQARDDHGLRDLASSSLDSAVTRKKDDSKLRFKHALVQYQFGRIPEAEASFAAYLAIEKSPYYAWRGGVWHSRVKAELAAMKSQDEKNAKDTAVARAKQAAEDALTAEKEAKDRAAAATAAASAAPTTATAASAEGEVSPELAAKRKGVQDQIDKLDVAIAAAANTEAVKAAAGAYGAKYGKLVDRFVGSAAGQAKINELKKQRAALQTELEAIK